MRRELFIEKINPLNFDWQKWRGGTLLDIGVRGYRRTYIKERAYLIRKYALGYCHGENLICRPKTDHYAVMFQTDKVLFWTHLRKQEFEEIFDDKSKII